MESVNDKIVTMLDKIRRLFAKSHGKVVAEGKAATALQPSKLTEMTIFICTTLGWCELWKVAMNGRNRLHQIRPFVQSQRDPSFCGRTWSLKARFPQRASFRIYPSCAWKNGKIHGIASLQIHCFQSSQYLAKTNRGYAVVTKQS